MTGPITSALQALVHLLLKKPCEADIIFSNLQMRKLRHGNIPKHNSIHTN